MPVTAFNHYNLRSPQPMLDTLRDFYVNVVGLRVGPRPPFEVAGYWLYVGEHAVLHLTERAGAAKLADAPAGEPRNSFDHAAFSCIDPGECEVRLKRHGIVYRIGSVPLTGQTQIFFSDPAGNGVELNFG